MTTPASPPPSARIVVGVDGSAGSLAALRWAVAHAAARGLALHVVTAWDFPIESTYGDMATGGDFHPVLAAEKVLATALADAGVSTDDDTITTAPVQGHPAEVLLEMAQTCELLVVGSRGHGKVLGALLGSVSHYLAGHAPCPVVVVKPPTHPGHRHHDR